MFIFRLEAGQISITITAASNLINKTEGLLGIYDENTDNDLKVRDGPTLAANSSQEVIYGEFGESCECSKCPFTYKCSRTHTHTHTHTHTCVRARYAHILFSLA